MTLLPRIDEPESGGAPGWYLTKEGSLWVVCPSCLKPSHARYHLVGQDGKMGPRFTCSRYHPETRERCDFKEWLLLGEWPQALIKVLGQDGPKYAGGQEAGPEPEQDESL